MEVISQGTSINIVLLISIISISIAIFNFFSSRKKDNDIESENRVKVNIKLDGLCSDMREVKEQQKNYQDKQEALIKNIADRTLILERDQKTLWNRVDELKEKIEHLEKGE